MSDSPVIFLSFANDSQGRFLEALEPERRALRQELTRFQRNGWGYYHSASSSTPEDLLEDLQLYPGYISIFHFSGHSDGEHLQLERPGGAAVKLHRENISAILREEAQSQLKLVFLNACKTTGLLETFRQIGVPALIATHDRISDILAKEFSLAFYRSLLNGHTLETAFLQAKSILETDNPERRISAFRLLEIGEKEENAADDFEWGLYYQHKDILSWRLLEGKVSDPKSATKALNKIPGSHQDFVGRDKELRELRHLLQKEKPVLLLNGIGGIGKTTLARQYLHENYFHFDNIVWVSVLSEQGEEDKGFQTATEAIGNDIGLMEELGMVFEKEQKVVDRAREVLQKLGAQTGKNLLVIDNAGFSMEEIRKELPTSPYWQVLLTSRKELSGLSVKKLDELLPEEALKLFCLHYPQGKNEGGELERLLDHIGYHTLTLELFAKTCQKSPSTNPGKILSLLQAKELEKLSRKVFVEHSDREVEVYGYLLAAFELHELSEKELNVLIQWAVLPSQEIDWELLCQIYQVSGRRLEEFEDTLIGLQEKGWIEKGESGANYRTHQLIQEVIRYKHAPNTLNCAAVIQGTADLLAIDEAKDNPIDKFPFVIFGEHILQAIKVNEDKIAKLQNHLALVYRFLGEYDKAANLLEITLSFVIEYFGEDHSITSGVRSNLGLVYLDLGKYEPAIHLLESALKSDIKNLGEGHYNVAKTRTNLGLVYHQSRDLMKARVHLEKALAINLGIYSEEHPLIARSRSNLAIVYKDLGFFKESVDLLEKALSSDLENYPESHPEIALKRYNLGLSYHDVGEFDKAEELITLALAAEMKNLGESHPNVAMVKSGLALLYRDRNKLDKAVNLLEEVIISDIKNFGENHPKIAQNKNNLGNAYIMLGEYDKAKKHLFEALELCIKIWGLRHPHTIATQQSLNQLY